MNIKLEKKSQIDYYWNDFLLTFAAKIYSIVRYNCQCLISKPHIKARNVITQHNYVRVYTISCTSVTSRIHKITLVICATLIQRKLILNVKKYFYPRQYFCSLSN